MSKPRTGAPKRVAVGLLAGALAVFGVALAPPAGAVESVTSERLAGATRYGTASAIAADEAFATPAHVIVATGENFPDALAASTLSGANAPAPILLTDSDTLSTEAGAGLDALKAKGVTAATIVGGTAAVSDAVQTAIIAKGFTVTRVAGTNRYETAAAIANAADARQDSGSVAGQKTALIATGLNFPDALAGGPAAVRNDLPLLLVDSTVPAATRTALTTLGIQRAVILGGTSAVSEAVATELQTITGSAPTRLAGTNRFGTAAAVGNYEIATLSFPATSAVLATGMNFPDALASGPLAGQLGAPIVLTASLPTESQAFLDQHSNTIAKLYVAGGTAAIDEATVTAAEAAAETVSNDVGAGQTSRPELVSASVISTVTSGLAAGTTVRYTFDEAVTTPVAGSFWVIDAAGTRTAGSAGGGTATVVASDARSVDVLYPGITSAATASGLTLATVDNAAVTDLQGEQGTEDDAPLGTTQATALPAGVTQAPDLQSVSFTAANSTQTFVDFVFDQAATNGGGTTNYRLVPTAGLASVDTCTLDSGQGTATHRVLCNNTDVNAGGTQITSANIARAFVVASTVTSATGQANPLQAADVSGSGITGTPDLVSATFNRDAKDALGNDIDQATLVFDQPVTTATASAFDAYYVNGTESVDPTSAQTSAVTPNNVLLSFADGVLTNAVGVSVDDNAVLAASGSNIGVGNEEDEVGVAGSTAGTTGGSTGDPDLTTVLRTPGTDVFGTPTGGYNITYVFDEDVDPLAITGTSFFLYLADGTRLQGKATHCFGGATEATDNTVTCTTTGGTTAYTVVVAGTPDATNAQILAAVLGTVDNGAAGDETGANFNHEAARPVTAPPASS